MAVILHIFRFPSYAGTSPMRITTIHSVPLPFFRNFVIKQPFLPVCFAGNTGFKNHPSSILTAFQKKINSYFGKIFATFLSRFCFSS